jgi:ligand-binding sensor domain-containing protein/serine phosphatase RsbU (regulator of sigma subunit)
MKPYITLFFLFTGIYCFAQNQSDIKFSHISLEQGLSQSVVYDIFQDRDGLLWFGTQDGLNSYDGYKFTVFQNDPKDDVSGGNSNKSLSNNSVRGICEDNSGVLWICTENGGVNRFDKYSGKFTVYKNEPNNPACISSNASRCIYADWSGNIWIGTDGGGLNKLEIKSGKITVFKHNPEDPGSISSNNILVIMEDKSGLLWVGTSRGGLNVLDKNTGKFKTFINNPEDNNSISSNNIQSIYEDRAGIIWIGTDGGGLNSYNKQTGKFINYKNTAGDAYSLSNNNVWEILEDNTGQLWVSTYGGGLNKFDNKTGKFTIFKNDPLEKQSLSNNYIYSLYQDNTGTIWAGTYGGGLNKFNKNTGKFTIYRKKPNQTSVNEKESTSLSSNAIRSVLLDRSGCLWIGTRGGGLNKFDKATGKYTIYKNDPGDKNSLSSNSVYAITEDKDGTLWIGTFGGGLNRLDKKTGTFTCYKNDPADSNSLSSNAIRTMMADKEGNLWIGTDGGGLNKFNIKTGKFTVYRNDPDSDSENEGPESLSNNFVYSVFESSDGTLWAGTDGGVNKLDKKTGKFYKYQSDPLDPYSLSNNSVYAIIQDKTGTIWVGTDGGGLNRLIRLKDHSPHRFISRWKNIKIENNGDEEIIKFKRYTIYDGLPNNCIYAIAEDGKGNLWLTTNKGLCKFSPPMHSASGLSDAVLPYIRNYDTYDGLPSNEFNLGAVYNTRKGIIFFGSINGLLSFHPDSLKEDKIRPSVVITNFLLFNKQVNILPFENRNLKDSIHGKLVSFKGNYYIPQSITYTKEITLSYADKVFTFEFAALHYSIPEKNEYAYFMEGFDKDWNYVGKKRYASYTNLSPGTYTFRVKASNCDGKWNEEGVSIKITILPPFWQTWWFRLIVFIAIISIIAIYIKWRERKLKNDKLILESTVKERTEQLREANEELNLQNEEISAQRDNLQRFNAELKDKNEEIQSQKDEIEEQRDKIQKQKNVIEHKNTNITASITYAKRIQSAILPPQELLNKLIPDSFILFKPKSIVSGDFYWVESTRSHIYFAVVDCTGHGVPGALMSVVGYNLLNQALKEKNIDKPSEIMDYLANNLSKTLRQTDTDTSLRDGMDMILCRVNLLSFKLEFAGAHCPLYLYRDGEITVFKTDKFSIGQLYNEKFSGFESKEIELRKNDIIYLFTDGYIDQFGGDANKKIMAKRFREIISQIAEKSMEKQKQVLDRFLEDWKSKLDNDKDQTDDITVMGIRF